MAAPYFRVYLAGPITGASYGTCTNWRKEVKDQLDDMSKGIIKGYSPMRSKEYLADQNEIKDFYPDTLSVMSTQRGITARDRYDCMSSDVVFVNMLGAERVSIGTVLEMAWADSKGIPIVLVMEETGNFHDHSMIREIAPFTVRTLEEAVLLTTRILLP
jgi:nucleoside 2-deoxyribosyltransferase